MSSSNFEMGCSVDRRLDTSEGNSSTRGSHLSSSHLSDSLPEDWVEDY